MIPASVSVSHYDPCLVDSVDCVYILYLLEWLKSTTWVTAYAGKDMEQVEHSFIACGGANLYIHYENHYGSSSENWESICLKT